MRSSAVQYVWASWLLYIKMFKHPGGWIKNAHTVDSGDMALMLWPELEGWRGYELI